MSATYRRRNWTTAEDDRIRALAGRAEYDRLAGELGRSYASVAQRALALGVARPNGIRRDVRGWTVADDAALADLWEAGVLTATIGAKLGRTTGAIESRRSRIGLESRHPARDPAEGREQEDPTPEEIRERAAAIRWAAP